MFIGAVIPRYSKEDQNYRHPFPKECVWSIHAPNLSIYKEHVYLCHLISGNAEFALWILKFIAKKVHEAICFIFIGRRRRR